MATRTLTFKEKQLYDQLKAELPEKLQILQTQDEQERNVCYARWANALDLLRLMISCATDLMTDFNNRNMNRAGIEMDFKFTAIMSLNARGLRVANEIYFLLIEGYPDGALSRWRTLHEITTLALFINRRDGETAKRYVAHSAVVAIKLFRDKFAGKAKHELHDGERKLLEIADAKETELVADYGQQFLSRFGWACDTLSKKKVGLEDLEDAAGLNDWREAFRTASRDIHAADTPFHSSFGAIEFSAPGHLFGKSDSGFSYPGGALAITLSNLCQALPTQYRTRYDNNLLKVIQFLFDETLSKFTDIENSTFQKASKNSSAMMPSRDYVMPSRD